MKLIHYLNESEHDITTIVRKLKSCTQILKEYELTRKVLFRGINNRFPLFQEKSGHVQSGRTPMNTNKVIHEYLNKGFTEKFGWPVRNGVFASAKMNTALFYGRPFVFFPKNGFSFVYSPDISDLYMLIDNRWAFNGAINREVSAEGQDRLDRAIESYTDKSLHTAIMAGVEIIFNTDKYYALSLYEPNFPDIMEALDMLWEAKQVFESYEGHDLPWSLTQKEFLERKGRE